MIVPASVFTLDVLWEHSVIFRCINIYPGVISRAGPGSQKSLATILARGKLFSPF